MIPREDIRAVYEQGVDAVVDLVQTLSAQLDEQREMIAALTTRIEELEDQLAKNSRNSSKPPSSDTSVSKPNPKSLRTNSSSRKPGGQKGHPGRTLCWVENPDRVVLHDPHECEGCGMELEALEPLGYERRQLVDVPPLALEVTEHRARRKKCIGCGHTNTAPFPKEASSVRGVSYGPRIKALCVYLMGYQLLPYERARELVLDLFGSPAPGAGTLHSALKASFEGLEGVEERIKAGLRRSQVGHFDETGLRVSNRGMWVHVASTPSLTHYGLHSKRGNKATDEIGILPSFGGVAMHDGWAAYRTYEGCSHALCNAHHLRELTFIEEEHEQVWAGAMKRLLVRIEGSVREAVAKVRAGLSSEELEEYERSYEGLLRAGFEANPPLTERRGKRGPPKQSKGKNLVDRLEKDRRWVLRFMYDFRVPFDNNQAERDVRMVKVKQKISGCFRTERGARTFCRIRSYISTARKQGENVLGALESVFMGKPFIPDLPG
jgi:transposase